MDRRTEDTDESVHLINPNEIRSNTNCSSNYETMASSSETIVFDSKLMKTSTQTEEFTATWGGRSSLHDSRRLRRAHSWSGIPDDSPSEVRILRERLVRTQTKLRPGAVRHLSSHQRITLASLVLVDFMSFCSMSIMAPFFPKEASERGLSSSMCGLVFSFYAFVMFLTSPLFGKYLPTLGAKFMFISGMFLAGSCNILFGTLIRIRNYTAFTVLCFLVRGLEAVGASAYSTASYVFVVNAFPESIGSVLGILETFVGLGMSVGPALGGLLYSIGGFGLPFYSLGAVMILTVPLNFFWLSDCDEFVTGSKSASIFRLFKIPSIIITGLVIVIVSNTWAFLDPTLEPHLRQFGLSTKQIGLIFMLFSSLYGIFSPIWGWVADRVHNHWCMMVWGLFLSTVGLLLLGPSPFIPYLPECLWLDLVALSILGISVALTLLPTFQGVLTSSIYEGGCPEALATYSAVAGVWSCCYSLGEVLGPALGGALADKYGFALSATLCASACFVMAVVTLTFFSLRESSKWVDSNGSACNSIPDSDTTWNSNDFCRTQSAPECQSNEKSPLLGSFGCVSKAGPHMAANKQTPSKQICVIHNKNKISGSASVAYIIAYFLKFQYLTDMCIKLRLLSSKKIRKHENGGLYQNYLEDEESGDSKDNLTDNMHTNIKIECNRKKIDNKNGFCLYLDKECDSDTKNANNVIVKRNITGVATKLDSPADSERPFPDDIIRHNLQKVQFYEQNAPCFSTGNIFDGCECRDGVTYVRGTVTVSSAGACEV